MIRFIKHAVQPNPIEADYWIDIKADPYGKIWKYYDGHDWVEFNSGDLNISELQKRIDQLDKRVNKIGQYGNTRPTLTTNDIGFNFFDTDLNKPIWWAGTKWVDANGDIVRGKSLYSLSVSGTYIDKTIMNTDAPNANTLVINFNGSVNLQVFCIQGDVAIGVPMILSTPNSHVYRLQYGWDKLQIKGNVSGTNTLIELYQE